MNSVTNDENKKPFPRPNGSNDRALQGVVEPASRLADPLVSVLLLTWNHGLFIRPCVESILDQSYNNIELICCENGSSDATWAVLHDVAAEYPHRKVVMYQNPPGTPVNMGFNGLIERASGDLVCFFSGDDLFCEDRVALQVKAFVDNPDLELVYSNGRFLGGHRDGALVHDEARFSDVFREDANTVLRYVLSSRALMIQALMAKTSLIRAIGGFDQRLLADDWILNIRLFRYLHNKKQYAYMPIVAFSYRQHENNSYKNFVRQSRLMIEVIESYYDFPDRRSELAKMYYLQAALGAGYGFEHLGLTLSYLRTALKIEFQPKNMLMILPRFFLTRPLRLYRKLRER